MVRVQKSTKLVFTHRIPCFNFFNLALVNIRSASDKNNFNEVREANRWKPGIHQVIGG